MLRTSKQCHYFSSSKYVTNFYIESRVETEKTEELVMVKYSAYLKDDGIKKMVWVRKTGK